MVRIASFGFGVVLTLLVSGAVAQQTPPIAPKTVDTLVPPDLTLPGANPPADMPGRPLTANEAARIAVAHQPTVEAARQAVEAAKGRTQQVRAATQPNVLTAASYTDVESLNFVNGAPSTAFLAAPGFLASATLKQLLFDFQHTRELVKQSALLQSAAQDALLREQYDLVLQTKQAYYLYANNIRALRISEESLTSRQKQLDLAQARLKSGLGLPSDVARAETSQAQGVTALSTARSNASLARINLALIMGIDPRTPIGVTMIGEPDVSSSDMNSMVTAALKQRPEMREAEDNLQSSRHGLNAARTTNAPVVSGSLGLTSRGTSFPPQADAFSVGVSINWNPFDGGFTQGKVKEARANEAIALANKNSTQLSVVSDVSQAFAAMRYAAQKVVSARNSVTNAQEGLRIALGRFGSGLGLFLDITDAETALESAQSDLTNAQYNVDQLRAALAHAIGTPVPTGP